MSNYTDYIPVPRARVVDIMENYGNDTISGTGEIHGAYFSTEDGDNNTPSYTFTSDTNTGMYLTNTGFLGFAAGGSAIFNISSTGLRMLMAGSANVPTIRINETDTGFYYEDPNILGVATSGTLRATFSDTGFTLQNGTNVNEFSIDTTLSGNSDSAVPTEKAVKTYIDERVTKSFGFMSFQSDEHVATGSGTVGVCISTDLDGYEVTGVIAAVHTAGTTGTTDIQVRRRRLASDADLLTTKCTIDSAEYSSATAATPPVIGSTWKALEAGDLVYIDVDAISTIAPKGLSVTITATKP